ncbi:MAG TPA: DUF1707 domain-containing protein [Gaiellaceae bacterium]|jgi:hypothetical protein
MPDEPPHPALRAGDADRDRTVDVLRAAVVEGRLTLEEFGDRVGSAHLARTEDELATLVADLPAAPHGSQPQPTRHRALFSHLVRKGPLRLPASSSYRSLFGTIDLDLRQATIEAPEVELAVHNIFGTVTVLVPDGTDVRVEGGDGAFASLHLDTTSAAPVPGGPVVRIHASGIGGTLNVRTREPPRPVERLLGLGRA